MPWHSRLGCYTCFAGRSHKWLDERTKAPIIQLSLIKTPYFLFSSSNFPKNITQVLLSSSLLAAFHREVSSHRVVALLQVGVVAEGGFQEPRHPQALGGVKHVINVAGSNTHQIHQRKLAFQQESLRKDSKEIERQAKDKFLINQIVESFKTLSRDSQRAHISPLG